MDQKDLGYDVYSAMQEGKPFKSYKKAIIGKVLVRVINPFSGGVEEVLLYGNPYDENNETGIIDVWDVKGDQFFKKANSKHLKNGTIVEFERTSEEEVELTKTEKYNQLTDKEIEDILKKPFFAMTSALEAIDRETTVIRFLSIAKKLNKSQNWLGAIEERLSEIQRAEYEEE